MNTIAEVRERLAGYGCPALPVGPAQPAEQYPAKGKFDRDGNPLPAYTGKNPSFLDVKGQPQSINHQRYQDKFPIKRLEDRWFANPANGIGTLGGWGNIYWIDLDLKQFDSQEDCDAAFAAIVEKTGDTWTEKTHSGGYRIAVKLAQPPGFTNFTLEPGGNHVGEVLGKGRFTVLAPTIGPSGNPYVRLSDADPVEVESLEAIGIYPTRKATGGQQSASTPRPVRVAAAGRIDLADLLTDDCRAILEGTDAEGDRSASLTKLIKEAAGWVNWCNFQGFGVSGTVEALAAAAGAALGIDGDRVGRILGTVELASCQPAAQIRGSDDSCWKKIRRLDRATWQQFGPGRQTAAGGRTKKKQPDGESQGGKPETQDALVFNFLVVEKLYSDTQWITVNNKLYRWVETHYALQTDEQESIRIQKLAEDTAVYDYEKERTTWPFAKVPVVKSALQWVKIKFAVDPDQVNPPGINCTNGVRIWNDQIKDFELLPHSPERYYLYEPLATHDPAAPTEDCDRLLAALNPEQIQILLRTVSAAIDPKLVRKRRGRGVRAVLARGTGSNGKDAHREAFSMLWGRTGCVSVAFEDFAQYDGGRKFPLAALRTARINWASENSGVVNIDRLQSLKRAITGDPLHCELKGQDSIEFIPNVINFFNINDIPRLGAAQEAIRSRFAVLDYDRVYKIGADESKGELEADPRFKYDPDFIQINILPALLNKVEQAFKDLLAEGVDYSCTDAALDEIRSYNSHLWDFVRSVGLEADPTGTVAVSEVWASLESWYQETGVLEVEASGFNKEIRVWAEPIRTGDQFVKGANQIYKRMLELFAGLKQFDMGGNRKGIKGLKFIEPQPAPDLEPKPQVDVQPQPVHSSSPSKDEAAAAAAPTTRYQVGDSVQLPDGRIGKVTSLTPSGCEVQNGKPDLEHFGFDLLRLAKGTVVRHLARTTDPIGKIAKVYPDGYYQVDGRSWTDPLLPSQFEVVRPQEGPNE